MRMLFGAHYYNVFFQCDQLAAGLLELGLKKGDRVGIWGPNMLEWMWTQFATARIGLILVKPFFCHLWSILSSFYMAICLLVILSLEATLFLVVTLSSFACNVLHTNSHYHEIILECSQLLVDQCMWCQCYLRGQGLILTVNSQNCLGCQTFKFLFIPSHITSSAILAV